MNETLRALASGMTNPSPLVDEVVKAALELDTPRDYDLYLVWTSF